MSSFSHWQCSSLFKSTPWSVVAAAGHSKSTAQHAALEKLCGLYWRPLFVYVLRRVRKEDLAQDLTQSFFEKLLSGRSLEMADPARGRFRTFLINAFNWHLANEYRSSRAQKRGGQSQSFALGTGETEEIADHQSLTAEQLFDREWALALLKVAMNRLRDEQSSHIKLQQFELLKVFLSGDRVEGGYQNVAERLQLNESAARMAVSRLRSRYRELLREEILGTVASREDVDDEIRHMFAVLSLPS